MATTTPEDASEAYKTQVATIAKDRTTASDIPIVDFGGGFDADNIEDALAELDDRTNTETTSYPTTDAIPTSESGNFIDNAGAQVSVVLFLPVPVKGLEYVVTKVADYLFQLDLASGTFVGSVAGK